MTMKLYYTLFCNEYRVYADIRANSDLSFEISFRRNMTLECFVYPSVEVTSEASRSSISNDLNYVFLLC